MMDTPFASQDDVTARLARPLSEAEQGVVDTLLDDACDMVRSRWPDVDARIESGALREASLTRIVAGMVKRALDRPSGTDGMDNFTQGTGPFTFGGKLSESLYFRKDDVRLLDGRGRRAFAVDLASPPQSWDCQ